MPPFLGVAGGEGFEFFEVSGVVDEDVEAVVEGLADLIGDGFDVGVVEDVALICVDFWRGIVGLGLPCSGQDFGF